MLLHLKVLKILSIVSNNNWQNIKNRETQSYYILQIIIKLRILNLLVIYKLYF